MKNLYMTRVSWDRFSCEDILGWNRQDVWPQFSQIDMSIIRFNTKVVNEREIFDHIGPNLLNIPEYRAYKTFTF